MIIVKLMGGLGNQMFQYAFAKALAEKNDDVLKLDVTDFSRDLHRSYALDVFNIDCEIALDDEIKEFRKKRGWFDRFFNKPVWNLEEGFHVFREDLLKLPGDIYLEGYYQCWRYMDFAQCVIEGEYCFSGEVRNENSFHLLDVEKSESVSIHIRRGDYVANKEFNAVHGLCSMEYYEKSMQEMERRLGEVKFFVFSDDYDWVKENLGSKKNVTLVRGNSAFDDLFLMAACKHNIIANSSFSWWGAVLNKNEYKVVVAPQNWYRTKNRSAVELLPGGWLLL